MSERYLDVDRLRHDLMDHFGTSGFPFAYVAVARVESADPQDLVSLAEDEGFDIESYTYEE